MQLTLRSVPRTGRCPNPTMILLSIIVVSLLHSAAGMDCEFGRSPSILDTVNFVNPKSCPSIVDSKDKKYCCVDDQTGLHVCCDFDEFLGTDLMAGIVLTVIVLFLVTCCLCCCCCQCCPVYKRRHAGAVYGRVVQPGTQTVITVHQPVQQMSPYPVQQAAAYPVQQVPQPYANVNYMPTEGGHAVYPPPGLQSPPTYNEATTNEVYTKQAPYNPNYQ